MPFKSDRQRKAVMAKKSDYVKALSEYYRSHPNKSLSKDLNDINNKTEHQLTTLFAKKKISPYEYQQGLMRVASSRHKKDINKIKYRASMSSSKWS